MTDHTFPAPASQRDDNFDLSRIFIGREQQLDLFEMYLTRWQKLLSEADPNLDTPATAQPSPNNKLQGLVVLLYGRGGFGKSTLLIRYRDIARQEQRHLHIGKIVDWEFQVEGKRALFNPPAGQDIDTADYYKVLCGQFALALDRQPKDFRAYQIAVKDVEQARKKAGVVLDRMQSDDRYAALRGVGIDAVISLLNTGPAAPVIKLVGSEKVKTALNEGVKIGAEQLAHVRAKLRDALGSTFGDYLDAPLRLGLALGHDLHEFARNFPLLIFLDTYEEVDAGDQLLRTVMAAAGLRVGWVIAGRDNLWGGTEQRKRSIGKEYGYKDIVNANRALNIDFNVGGVGAFSATDIKDYFDGLCASVQYEPPLPAIDEEEAEQIRELTQGVPLAVNIAAGLYLETTDIALITTRADTQREVVDEMVERYLLHARDNQDERMKLYGLALVRRADQPSAIATALNLTAEQAPAEYETELSRLHRRYSFIFTEKDQPSLHQEVRHFLRHWLLARRKEPAIVAINERLKTTHEDALKKLEAHMQYTTLQERFQDKEWVDTYLDLTEQLFWLEPVDGVRSILPFMMAAAVYGRDINKNAKEIGSFFEKDIRMPYQDWWKWAKQSLVYPQSRNPSKEELAGLGELVQLAEQRCPTFPSMQQDYRDELKATLWWRLGEAYGDQDGVKALEWFEQALAVLSAAELKEAAAKRAWNIAYNLYEEKRHAERLLYLDRAITLKPDYINAYNSRGIAYHYLQDFPRAILDYDCAIAIDPNSAIAYSSRGIAYYYLQDFAHAILDYDHAIAIDPNDAKAYFNRGVVYHYLNDLPRAILDYDHAIILDPNDAKACYNRGNTYSELKNFTRAILDYDRAIALDPTYAIAYNNRGYTYANLTDFPRAILDYDHAITFDPNNAKIYNNRGDAYSELKNFARAILDYDRTVALSPNYAKTYFKRATCYLFLKNSSPANVNYHYAYSLNPKDINAAWMVEWITMDKQYLKTHMAGRLETIATLDPQDYVAYICRGVALGFNGKGKEGLQEIEQAIPIKTDMWDAYFWQGMLIAYYQGQARSAEAVAMIEQALKCGMPPILLTPLYWLKRDRPAIFKQYMRPLLVKYNIEEK